MFSKPRSTQISQILRASAHALPRTPSRLLKTQHPRFLSSSPSLLSNSVVEGVTVDQTKHDNSPDGEKRGEHEHITSSVRTEEGRNQPGGQENKADSARKEAAKDHPAKQADPQKSPERSTGFETDGPGDSKAGAGKDTGGVHQEKGKKPGPHQVWQGDGSPAT